LLPVERVQVLVVLARRDLAVVKLLQQRLFVGADLRQLLGRVLRRFSYIERRWPALRGAVRVIRISRASLVAGFPFAFFAGSTAFGAGGGSLATISACCAGTCVSISAVANIIHLFVERIALLLAGFVIGQQRLPLFVGESGQVFVGIAFRVYLVHP